MSVTPESRPNFEFSQGFEEQKPHHNCGVAAVVLDPDSTANAAFLTRDALQDLEHRGPDGGGVGVYDEQLGGVMVYADQGSTEKTLSDSNIAALSGTTHASGHRRYPTQGSSGHAGKASLQPLPRGKDKGSAFSLSHNGQFNVDIFGSASDTVHTADRIEDELTEDQTLIGATVKVLSEMEKGSAYSMILLDKEGVWGVRDPDGYHPLVYGYSKAIKGYVMASETPALENRGVKHEDIMSVPPGHILRLQSGKEPDLRPFVQEPQPAKICILETKYFARADGYIEGSSIYEMRMNMGKLLAENDTVDAEVVMAVPDSARAAGQGYAEARGLPYREGIIKATNKRSFLENEQEARQKAADEKHQLIRHQIENKDIVLVEDSIVRGTTLQKLVHRMKTQFGANSVHLRIASPPAMWTCRYGIDIPTREELIAFQKDGDVEAICEFLGADSLKYLSPEDSRRAVGGILGKRACTECFTGLEVSEEFEYFNPFEENTATPVRKRGSLVGVR